MLSALTSPQWGTACVCKMDGHVKSEEAASSCDKAFIVNWLHYYDMLLCPQLRQRGEESLRGENMGASHTQNVSHLLLRPNRNGACETFDCYHISLSYRPCLPTQKQNKTNKKKKLPSGKLGIFVINFRGNREWDRERERSKVPSTSRTMNAQILAPRKREKRTLPNFQRARPCSSQHTHILNSCLWACGGDCFTHVGFFRACFHLISRAGNLKHI